MCDIFELFGAGIGTSLNFEGVFPFVVFLPASFWACTDLCSFRLGLLPSQLYELPVCRNVSLSLSLSLSLPFCTQENLYTFMNVLCINIVIQNVDVGSIANCVIGHATVESGYRESRHCLGKECAQVQSTATATTLAAVLCWRAKVAHLFQLPELTSSITSL